MDAAGCLQSCVLQSYGSTVWPTARACSSHLMPRGEPFRLQLICWCPKLLCSLCTMAQGASSVQPYGWHHACKMLQHPSRSKFWGANPMLHPLSCQMYGNTRLWSLILKQKLPRSEGQTALSVPVGPDPSSGSLKSERGAAPALPPSEQL